jgi:hypothetical protein
MSNTILSIAWLIVAILALIAGIHKSVKHGLAESYPFLIIFLFAGLIFYLRHNRKTE